MAKKVITQILKQVGINGLIGIKLQLKKEDRNFYSLIKSDSLGFTAQNLIFHHRIVVKDFAQQH